MLSCSLSFSLPGIKVIHFAFILFVKIIFRLASQFEQVLSEGTVPLILWAIHEGKEHEGMISDLPEIGQYTKGLRSVEISAHHLASHGEVLFVNLMLS